MSSGIAHRTVCGSMWRGQGKIVKGIEKSKTHQRNAGVTFINHPPTPRFLFLLLFFWAGGNEVSDVWVYFLSLIEWVSKRLCILIYCTCWAFGSTFVPFVHVPVQCGFPGIEFSTWMQSGRFAFCNWFFYPGIGLFHRRYASSLLCTCAYWMQSGRFAILNAKRALCFWEVDFTRKIPRVRKVHWKGCWMVLGWTRTRYLLLHVVSRTAPLCFWKRWFDKSFTKLAQRFVGWFWVQHLHAKRALCFLQLVLLPGNRFVPRCYASSLLFTCTYWMQSRRFVGLNAMRALWFWERWLIFIFFAREILCAGVLVVHLNLR